jgi:hypothetical protein
MLNLAKYAGMAALVMGLVIAATKPASAWDLPLPMHPTATIPTTTRGSTATMATSHSITMGSIDTEGGDDMRRCP